MTDWIVAAGARLRRWAVLVCVAATGAVAASPADAEKWAIDTPTTQVMLSWDHLGIARHTARILDVRGTATFSPTDPEQGSVQATLRVGSLWTGTRELDDLMKGSDFLDATRHPEITFKSSTVAKTSERQGVITGELTILGVTRPVALQTSWNFTGEHPLGGINARYQGKWISGFSAETTILRSEWGIKRALPLVSDEIRITIEAELIRID